MGAVGEELTQPLARQRDRVGPRDAEKVETVRARNVDERRLERNRIAQKSRSA